MSLVRRLDGFFIFASLTPSRRARTDQADLLSPNSMDHNQQLSGSGHPDDYKPVFGDRMIRVWDRHRKRVVEDGARLGEPDPVLPSVRRVLLSIPLECEARHFTSSLTNREQDVELGAMPLGRVVVLNRPKSGSARLGDLVGQIESSAARAATAPSGTTAPGTTPPPDRSKAQVPALGMAR